MSAHEDIQTAGHERQSAPSSHSELSAQEYDAREAMACQALPNRVVEAFRPVTFGSFGYPVHVDDNEELWKYVDVMQENRFNYQQRVKE